MLSEGDYCAKVQCHLDELRSLRRQHREDQPIGPRACYYSELFNELHGVNGKLNGL